MTFTVTPVGIPAPFKYTFNGVLLYNGIETFANEPPFGTFDIGFPTYPVGIASAIAFGNPSLAHTIDSVGNISEGAIGSPTVGLAISPMNLPSGAVFGAAHLYTAIFPNGIPSLIAFGSAETADLVPISGIPSALAFGSNTEVFYSVTLSGIISSIAFGNFTTDHDVVDFGIPSAIAFGNPLIAFPINPQGFNNSQVGITNIGFPTITFNGTNLASIIYLYDPNFYNDLRAMETYCYAQTNGLSTYGSGFTALSNAIVAWITKSRQTLMSTYMNSLFSYIVMNIMYGTSNSLLSSAIYNRVWSIGGYNATIQGAPNTYYADGSGAKLTADANTITTTTTNGTDDTTAANLYAQFNQIVSNEVSSLSLNPTPPVPNPWSKTSVANLIFITLGYKNLYLCFNTNLTLPPGI